MSKSKRMTLLAASLCVPLSGTAQESERDNRSGGSADSLKTLEEVLIVATRDRRTSKGATGLEMSLAETPQSVTVLDRDTLDTFGFDEINDALRLTTGVNVEANETDRTGYNSRGFDILSMQVDGVGTPFIGLGGGALDSALYDKIEIVRGANGLLTGTGNPSGTVNYVRKRPTNRFLASSELTLGEWDRKRIEVDVSGPLVESGRWAARAVAAVEDKDTWLDLYHHERKLFYGVIDGQLGERTTVAFGYTHQESESDGVLWGALPFLYSDGTQAEYDVSTTTSQRWTSWDVHTDSAFAELAVQLSERWQAKTVLRYDTYRDPSELFFTFPSVVDRDTGTGIYGWTGKFEQKSRTLLSDTSLSGAFDAWGQSHEVTFGLSLGKSETDYYTYADPNIAANALVYEMPAFPGWTGSEVPRPAFGARELGAEWDEHLYRLYGATRLSVTDALKLIVGFNAVDSEKEGVSFGLPANQAEEAVSPYVGATWGVTDDLNAYVSYSDIYQPQSVVTSDLQPLGSAKGKSYEAGLKSEWLDKKLLAAVAVFKAEQDNLQQFIGYTGTNFIAYYEGISVRSDGYEIEVAGSPHDSLRLQAGYTHLSLDDPQGAATRTFIPRDTLKLLAAWRVPAITGLELGVSMRWQDEVYVDVGDARIRQGAYAIYGLQVGYQPNEHFGLNATLDNVTDKKHLASLEWDQAFYGEPRNVNVSLTWKY